MSELHKNAIAFLQKRFPTALVQHYEITFSSQNQAMSKLYPMIALDGQSGVKQRAIAIENLGSQGEVQAIAQSMGQWFDELLNGGVYIKMGNVVKACGHEIDTNQMTCAPRILLYTNKLCAPIQQVLNIFSSVNAIIDVVDESEMHKTLFISYGGPDEEIVSNINNRIKAKGVKTWFFPDDALPGEKLHSNDA